MAPSAHRRAASPPPGSVRIVADYVTQRGGAERVNLAFHEACPGSALTTSFYDQAHTYPEFGRVVIETSRFNRFPRLRRAHRAAFPIYPFRFGLLRVDDPVVICSTTGWSHWVRARGRKVVYWHAPARWLYQTDAYTGATGLAARAVGLVAPFLRRWDRAATASADVHLCNSTEIANRLRRIYGIEAEVLPPPHGMDPDAPREATPGLEPGFHLCVSRLLPYKNVEAVVAAFEHLPDERLVVVGEGPGRRALEQARPPNVELYSNLTDARLRWLYANCQALVAASYEDFGLTPLEAVRSGGPRSRCGGAGSSTPSSRACPACTSTSPRPIASRRRSRKACPTSGTRRRSRPTRRPSTPPTSGPACSRSCRRSSPPAPSGRQR